VDFHRICVLGLGYIGLPTASTFATHGVQVVGVDVNPTVVNTLQNGNLHIHEPGLRTLVQAALRSGNLVIRQTPEPADAFIIAVPTPFCEDKRADMSYVISAAESIVPHLKRSNLVVLESTSPPRTTQDVIKPILERSGLIAGEDFLLAYSPERVLPGQILRELIENARVVGGIDELSAEAGRDLYAIFARGEIFLTDATTAEMVKLMENTYRDVNIALANEFGRLSDRLGVDVWEAVGIANRHPRVSILKPGPGVGGHCISVDPWFLVEAAPDLTPLIRTARQVNDSQPEVVLDLVRRALPPPTPFPHPGPLPKGEGVNSPSPELNGASSPEGMALPNGVLSPQPSPEHEGEKLKGKRIAALGMAYKPDVDDLRESPAVRVACLLQQDGASVLAYEPIKPDAHIRGLELAPTLAEAIEEADALLLLVAHTSLCKLNPYEVAQLTPARVVIDTVNGWPAEDWEGAGFHYYQLGNGQKRQ